MSDIPHCTGCGEYPGDLVADRIEHLQAQRNFAQKQVVMAEAKLAKAVEALEAGIVCTSEHGGAAKFLRIARKTLAELKGEK